MLPDFRKARAGLREHLNAFLKERTKFHNNAFRDVPVMVIHEGTGSRTVNAESDFENDMELSSVQGSATVGHDELIDDPTHVFRMLDELAQQMAFEQGRMMVQTVSDVTERTGRVSKRKGDPGPEVILEMYEKMLITFNKQGLAELPAIHCAPEMVPKLKAALKRIQTEPEYDAQFQQLLARKRQEWNDRENNRKLVG
ncbi:MAG: hypothetical protein V4456_11180 [Bacteroidota bacterium]